MSTANGDLVHLLVFPFPAQGHLIPLLDFAHHLSLLLPGRLALTIVVTPANLPLLDHFLSATPCASPLVLPISSDDQHTTLPTSAEHVRHLSLRNPAASSAVLNRALSSLRPKLLSWASSHHNPPVALISDFFLGWTTYLAADLRIPRLTFYTSGAFTVAVLYQLWRNMPPVPADGPAGLVHLPSLPSSPSFPYYHLPTIFRSYKSGEPEWEFMKDAFLANDTSWGFVFNTFDALEGEYLVHLKRSHGHDRLWAVGPVSPAGSPAARGGQSSVPSEELTAWLDACSPGSVVYICFGSQYAIKESQGRTIAGALETSGVRFVWAVGAGEAAVPERFENRVAEKGLVIRGWAPQVAILRHAAVGSFLTHCGWNSVLEGVAAGVVLLAWPIQADQFLSTRLLVDAAGVAVKVGEGSEGGVPSAEELAKVFTQASAEGRWTERKARAAELGRKAAEAVGRGGRSFRDLEDFARVLSELRSKKR